MFSIVAKMYDSILNKRLLAVGEQNLVASKTAAERTIYYKLTQNQLMRKTDRVLKREVWRITENGKTNLKLRKVYASKTNVTYGKKLETRKRLKYMMN